LSPLRVDLRSFTGRRGEGHEFDRAAIVAQLKPLAVVLETRCRWSRRCNGQAAYICVSSGAGVRQPVGFRDMRILPDSPSLILDRGQSQSNS
jgi:hypothetical protein